MGESGNDLVGWLLGIIASLFVFLLILAYVYRVLNQFHKISAAEAIRFGITQVKTTRKSRLRLSNNKLLNTNIYLGMKDVLMRKRLYGTMLAVLVISTFIMIVPQNLYNTISSEDFIKYMGIGNSDLRIDIQQTEDISEKTSQIRNKMQKDSAISQHVLLTTKSFKAKMKDGSRERIKIELGDHSKFPVEYSIGRAPVAENEIALSVLNADEWSLKIGDTMVIEVEGLEKELIVTGIYSDITNGGKTTKAVFTDNSAAIMWAVLVAELSDTTLIENKVKEYAGQFPFAKVSDIDQYIRQTFGSTMQSVGKASYSAIGAALLLSMLITVLFMKMLAAKDRQSISVLKAIGFTNADIQLQYVTRTVFILIVGIVMGTILANTLGEILAGALISTFGASTFHFTINPLTAYVLSPLLLISTVLIATIIGTLRVGQLKILDNIKG